MVFVNHHTYIGTSILLSLPYCHFVIKSLDHEGRVVGVVVSANRQYTAKQVGGNTTKSSRGVAFFLQWRFCEIPTSQNSLLGILAKGVNRKDSGSAEDIYECVKCCLFAKQAIYLNTTLQSL